MIEEYILVRTCICFVINRTFWSFGWLWWWKQCGHLFYLEFQYPIWDFICSCQFCIIFSTLIISLIHWLVDLFSIVYCDSWNRISVALDNFLECITKSSAQIIDHKMQCSTCFFGISCASIWELMHWLWHTWVPQDWAKYNLMCGIPVRQLFWSLSLPLPKGMFSVILHNFVVL